MNAFARRSLWRLLLVACYALLMGFIVWGLLAARGWALAALSTPQAVGDWQAWREDVRRQQDEPRPVRRRVPSSAEPPALVLMRDHFPVMLEGAIVLGTVIYWVTAWLVVGALSTPAATGRNGHLHR
jgi:hypothetical protein